MPNETYYTSESVMEGHPDKICDQISDRILDALLEQDPLSRCACEVTCEPGAVHIMGEITSTAIVDHAECAREVIRKIGYTILPYLRPNGKAQATVAYHGGIPSRIDTIVLSAQHDLDVSIQQLRSGLRRKIMWASPPGPSLRSPLRPGSACH